MNMRIRVPEVRLIGEDGSQVGVVSTREALMRAQNAQLDLVEISPTAQPPVCRIMDYGKFKYETEKREKSSRQHASATRVKEIQLHPNVGDHDYQTKVRHLRDFVSDGHRVKVILFFRGRESAHQEIGFEVMNRVIRDTQDIAQTEQLPRLMGRNILMMLIPRTKSRGGTPVPGAAPLHASPRPPMPAPRPSAPAAPRPPAPVPPSPIAQALDAATSKPS
ncbi:MAG: translation initiation factor IF-3 [Kiritimatiellaeota bacterium]|nr:translation initiation factor IF-3 [Kiritimatiellota bacterium]